ncbi:polysaccharide deacetylase family protein [Bradyrhizobium sp. CSA207]|uniref:polysaccharide deacetylase family protein n=1 Tax=Bradyrhizobium sp. CSA207 TaxID=2698826 RepID=UPI0023AFE318|nr:polysaccharide deacetylase family protein [Bradyrhizobium sp. CSA207]MDE5444180.1 polysaccharide deacetylase family protein [Bradyrhizobium sp. CSA207]
MPWKQDYTISDEIGIKDADVRWPDGKRCAFGIVVDLSPASTPAGITESDLKHPTTLFGMTVGLQSVMRLLRRFGLRATFVVPTVMAEIYPDRIEAIRKDGHEIAAGGWKHEDVSTLLVENERERIELTTSTLKRIVGTRPNGWFSLPRQQDAFAVGSISKATMGLLIDAGYTYMGNGLADDAPHYWVADVQQCKTILTLPYHYSCDDQFFLMFPSEGTGLDRVNALKRNWLREFEAQYRRGRYFSLTVHPKGIGWGHHAEAFEEILTHLTSFPDLWNATGSECAGHWSTTYPADTFLRLSPSIWKDHEGSLS